MYYTETPVENGWYWVRFDDNIESIVHWSPENETPRLLWPNTKKMRLSPTPVEEVVAWIGPLPSPFGEFASDHGYFAEYIYRSAHESAKDAVMVHVYHTRSRMTVTNVGVVDHDTAVKLDAAIARDGL